MRKILLIIFFSILITPLYAGPKDKVRDGFISKKNVHPVKNDFNISDPKKKIILIYNHGQTENDMALQACSWVSMLRNSASLIDEEIDGKKIMVYNFCTNHLAGDMSPTKDWWTKTPAEVYKGKHKLDKRVEANLDLINKFVKQVFQENKFLLQDILVEARLLCFL